MDVGSITQTDFAFTGQRSLDQQGNATLGLMDYHARMYDSYLNQWTQPDTVIPQPDNPQSLNRYMYVLGNPVRYNDPTGHRNCEEDGYDCPGSSYGGGGSGTTITPSNCPSCYHAVGQSPQSNQLDPLREFSAITGITPQSACATLLGSPSNPLCDARTYNRNNYNMSNVDIPMPTSGEVSGGLGITSLIDGVAGLNPKLHFPIIGMGLDASEQLSEDSGKGYTFGEEAARVGIHVGEGQVSGTAATALAGGGGILGAETGPGDIVIIGGSYVIGSATTSFWLDVGNNTIASSPYLPAGWSRYIPQAEVPVATDQGIEWCYGTISGGC